MSSQVSIEHIQRVILFLRGHTVILDRDLAAFYEVSTRDLNKAVIRNLERFPGDFMVQLTRTEFNNLKCRFGTSRWGGTRKLPRAFTEQGVAMLSSVLRSTRAIHANIAIMRAFVTLRTLAARDTALASKLDELEHTVASHDGQIKSLFEAIRELMEPELPQRPRIGFQARPQK